MTENQSTTPDVSKVREFHENLKENIHKVIIGYDSLIDVLSAAVLTGGHILLEGVPGTAKTTICRMFADFIGGKFGRLQGAVDVQPADVLGFTVYSKEGATSDFRKGPIFSNIFLIDEINRLTPKTQSALIEPLAERQVTYDSVSYPLPKPFLTVASQNPYENAGGTFTLIDAQADRFAYSVVLTQLDREAELAVLDREIDGALLSDEPKTPSKEINIDIDALRSAVKEVHVSPEIRGYIADIIMATRKHGDVSLGSSTRGSISLLRGAQVIAAINGRGYVIPDDVKYIAPYTLRHRLFLKNEAVLSGVTQVRVLETILNTVTVR